MMRSFQIIKIVVFLMLCFSSTSVLSKTNIKGCWELIDISALNIMNTPPKGISSRKDYYSEDGTLYVIEPTKKIDQAIIVAQYEFDGVKRKIVAKNGNEVFTKSTIINDRLTLHFSKTEKWTYQYLGGEAACNEEIEPRSVLVVATQQGNERLKNLEVKYDENDYSELEIEERVLGVWEVNEHFEFTPKNAPPYGFSNKVYVFKDQKIYILDAGDVSIDGKREIKYSIKDGILTLDANGQALELEITFNKWGHLVLSESGRGFILKLLTKDINAIPPIPTKVVILRLMK